MLQNTWDFNGFIVLLQHWIDHTDLVDFIWKHVKKIICLWALFTSAKHPHNICKFYFHFTIILRSLFWDQVWKDKFGIFLIKLFWYIMKWGSIATLCYCDMCELTVFSNGWWKTINIFFHNRQQIRIGVSVLCLHWSPFIKWCTETHLIF